MADNRCDFMFQADIRGGETLAFAPLVALPLFCAFGPATAHASSHREAPFLTKMPKVDGTDFYMFNSYETTPAPRAGYVTLIANYQPVEVPGAGPNYYTMDPEALYEIHIDNNADAKEDITFQFRFQNTLANGGAGVALPIGPPGNTKNIAIPIINFGAISAADQSKLNVNETYGVKIVRGPRRSTTDVKDIHVTGDPAKTTFTKPVDYIGNTTFSSKAGYEAYVANYVYDIDIPGCTVAAPATGKPRVFVGQRADGFEVNLGTIFDLVGAPATAGVVTGGTSRATRGDDAPGTLQSGANSLKDKNVTTIAIEVPASCLTTGATGTAAIIGGWTTASVRQGRVINPKGSYTTPSKEGGAWAQVSRLGMPLVNEVIIGIKDKDLWNTSEPSVDTQFIDYVTNPVLPDYLNLLFGSSGAPLQPSGTSFPRKDLVAAFLTGVPMVNANGSTAEMVRLNTSLGFTPRGAQNSLGAAACFVNGTLTLTNGAASTDPDAKCDPNGFPNGRRPGDDVTDIELRVAMGYLMPKDATNNPHPDIPYTDYAPNYDTQFGTAFPYLNTPYPGH